MIEKPHKRSLVNVSIAKLIAASAALTLSSSVLAADIEKVARADTYTKIDATQRLQLKNLDQVEVFVELEEKKPLFSIFSQSDAKPTAGQMSKLRSDMRKFPGKEMREKSNDKGVAWKVRSADVDKIKSMPEVKRVSYIIPARAGLSNSVPWIGAPDVWATTGTGDDNGSGEPVTIAIIDSGIDYFHSSFGGAGDPAEFAANDPFVIEPGSFPTPKVIGGFDFAGADQNNFAPDPDPTGVGSFHGTHVAGIASSDGGGDVAPGVAPGADLYAVKVFADNGGGTTLTHLGIQWSEDPNQDGDNSDRADVMNLSLGSSFGRTDDVSSVAANEAAKNGSVVVISAGNSGDVPYIHGGPAVAPNSISVANSVPGGIVQGIQTTSSSLPASGTFIAVEGAHTNTIAGGGLISGDLVAADAHDGCTPLTNAADIAGNVALIIRGGCAFDTKYANAEAAGASGLIVYNDGADPSRVAPFVMGGLDPSRSLTGVMVSFDLGSVFKAALDNSESVTALADASIKTATDPAFDDTLAGSTSRGPGLDNSFKPDVTAPGSGILSTMVGTGTGAAPASGTSMAAPHVAGVAALLKQKWPRLKPAAIKAMLQNSSVPAYRDGVAGASDPYPLTLQGVGRVQADVANTLTSFARPGGVSFGRVNAKWGTHLSKKITVRNLSRDTKVFTIRHEPNQTMDGVSMRSYVQRVQVPGRSSRKFSIAMSFNPRQATFDAIGNSQREVDGWFVLEDELSDETLRVGYMAVVDPASGVKAFNSYNSLGFYNAGGSDSYAEGFTLADKFDVKDQPKEAHVLQSLGYRTGVTLFGAPAIDFAFVTKAPWASFGPMVAFMEVDSDEDGTYETFMQILDSTPDGVYDSVVEREIFPGGYGLGQADYDYNDRVMIARYVIDRNGLAPDLGFLDPGDLDFNYRAGLFNFYTGQFTEFEGTIDLSQEVVVDNPSFIMPMNGRATSELLSDNGGKMLWLYQQNQAKDQAQIINVRARRR